MLPNKIRRLIQHKLGIVFRASKVYFVLKALIILGIERYVLMLLSNSRCITLRVSFVPNYGAEVVFLAKDLSEEFFKVSKFVLVDMDCDYSVFGQKISRHSEPRIHHR